MLVYETTHWIPGINWDFKGDASSSNSCITPYHSTTNWHFETRTRIWLCWHLYEDYHEELLFSSWILNPQNIQMGI